jgi:glycosyltransferase involved in cell wall biosynthesis
VPRPPERCYDFATVRILLDYRPALRHRTGVGAFAHGLAAALVTALAPEDTLTLFSSSWKDRLPARVVPGARQVDRRIPVRALNYAWHHLEWPPVERLAGPVDVAHSLHPLMMPARAAVRVVTIHDLYFLDHAHRTAAEIRDDYPGRAADHARRADVIIVPSQYTATHVRERFKVAPDRIVVCSPGAPDWPARTPPSSPGPILFVGTVEPRKNVPGLLKAYSRLVSASPGIPPLVIAGRLSEPVVTLTPSLPPAAVRWLGYVDDETRLRLYREASLLVIPSFDEGFGIPALEAMTIGLPVVAARRGALPEVLVDAAVYVEPDDEAAIASAMAQVLDDVALRTRMITAGLVRARQFRWESSARRAYAAYVDAVARRQGHA